MQIHTHWRELPLSARGASVAMGNFDGVHLGHRSVIELAGRIDPAASGAGPSAAPPPGNAPPLGVVTFEPHPREYFFPDSPPFRLMNAQARAHRMEKLGVAHLYEIDFDERLAGMDAGTFAREVLAEGLGVAHVTIGGDFRFGRDRSGTAGDMLRMGEALGFGVTIAPLLAIEGLEISSTAIRRALAEGRPRDAAEMLGHWHRIEGPVIHGEKRGRELGYPTANMSVAGLHLPKLGIYAVSVDVLTGPQAGTYAGAASLGVRPTFGVHLPNLETTLLDFSGDLYGHQLSVAFVDYLRPELRFDGVEALVQQMEADCGTARDILAAL